jgi:uncharacterized membrane protein YeaQ/YmgE (transglycosylase-associated protein family)
MPRWLHTIVIGFVCGLIARALLPGYDGMGWIMTTLVGIGGAYVGTAIGQGMGKLGQNQAAGWLWSIVGSIVILVILRIVW